MNFKMAKDIGNGTDKCAIAGAQSIIPNVAGMGDTHAGELDLGGLERRRRRGQQEPYVVSYDGIVNVLTGHNVRAYCKDPVQRVDDGRFADNMETRCVTYAAFHELLGPGDHEGTLVLGVPVDKLKGDEAKAFKREVKGWLVGTHDFIVNGQASRVTITGIQFAAQPVGAFFEWGMDDRGQWVRSEAEFLQDTGIIDIGYGTLDLFVVSQGQVNTAFTAGDNLGMGRVAESVVEIFERMHRAPMSTVEADELVRQYVISRGKPVRVVAQGREVDITAIIKTSLDTHGSAVIDYIRRAWRNFRFQNVLLTGGGSLVFGDRLTELYPFATLLSDPITANARGLAKLGQRG